MKRYELDGIIKMMMAEAYYKGAVEGTGLNKEEPDFRDIVKDAWEDVEEDIFADYEDEIRETLDNIIRDEINEDADEIERMAAEDEDLDPEEDEEKLVVLYHDGDPYEVLHFERLPKGATNIEIGGNYDLDVIVETFNFLRDKEE